MALKEKQQLKYSVFRKYPEVTLETITEAIEQSREAMGIWKTAGREMTMWKLRTSRAIWEQWVAKIVKNMLLLGGRNNYRGLMTKLMLSQ